MKNSFKITEMSLHSVVGGSFQFNNRQTPRRSTREISDSRKRESHSNDSEFTFPTKSADGVIGEWRMAFEKYDLLRPKLHRLLRNYKVIIELNDGSVNISSGLRAAASAAFTLPIEAGQIM